jgi:imidazolonepropionase-like amidohydrolase
VNRETEIGALMPGRKADFVVLNIDPRDVEPHVFLPKTQLLMTFLGGVCMFSRHSNFALVDVPPLFEFYSQQSLEQTKK